MKRSTIVGLICVAMFVASGCKSVTVRPVDEADKDPTGVVYYLPRTLLKVSITYNVHLWTTTVAGVAGAPEVYNVTISKPIALTPMVGADPDHPLVASGLELTNDAFLEGTCSLTVDENGVLVGVTADFLDRSPEVATNLATAALNIAKAVAIAGKADQDTLQGHIKHRIESIDKNLGNVLDNSNSSGFVLSEAAREKYKQWTDERAMLVGLLKTVHETDNTVETNVEVVCTTIINPLTGSNADGKGRETIIRCPKSLLSTSSKPATLEGPAVHVWVLVNDDIVTRAEEAGKKAGKVPYQGIVYRQPRPTLVEVTIGTDEAPVFSEPILLAQLGTLGIAPAAQKPWAKLTTTMTLSKQTGGLTNYSAVSTSSAAAASKAAADISSTVQSTLSSIKEEVAKKETPTQTETDMLKQQQELLEQQLKTEKARKDLQDYIDAQKSATTKPGEGS